MQMLDVEWAQLEQLCRAADVQAQPQSRRASIEANDTDQRCWYGGGAALGGGIAAFGGGVFGGGTAAFGGGALRGGIAAYGGRAPA